MTRKNPAILWHFLSLAEVAKKLRVGRDGLDASEAQRRLKRFGPNEIPEKGSSGVIAIFLRQFKSTLAIILFLAFVMSAALGDFLDAYVILAAILVNVFLGAWQEWQAEKAIRALKSLIQWEATVIREGRPRIVLSQNIVPGDLVELKAGEKVPADLRIFEASELEIDEAILSGESLPAKKNAQILREKNVPLADRDNMAFMGTLVVRGRGMGIVVATGALTAIGEITAVAQSYKETQTPLQEKMAKLSRSIGIVVVIFSAFVLGFGLLRGLTFWQILKTAVALAVSAVPEGLLIGVTVVLALGARDLLKKKALVRRLVSTETLGSTTVICVDKTGTLTQGLLKAVRIITLNNDLSFAGSSIKIPAKSSEELIWVLRVGVLCNDARTVSKKTQDGKAQELEPTDIVGDPVDRALLTAGNDAGMDSQTLLRSFKKLKTIPFQEESRYMATLHKFSDKYLLMVKGAPEVILDSASKVQKGNASEALDTALKDHLADKARKLSKDGLKVLGFAYKYIKSEKDALDLQGLTLLGFVGLKDPLRPEAKNALSLARKAHVHTIMITGDHKLTAYAIAKELGLKVSVSDIKEEKDLDSIELDGVTVYARITPKGKLKIVEKLKELGEVVAMTGDGVNDVPALKAADIGLALGSGSQAARDMADIVLLDNNFNVVVAALEQGRKIIEHIRTVVFYLLSHSFGEILVISLSIAFGQPLALLPFQILWINLANDSLPHLALAKESYDDNFFDLPPEKRQSSLLKINHWLLLGAISLIAALGAFSVYYFFYRFTGDLNKARTMAFAILGLDALFFAFSLKNLRHTIFCKSPFRNKYLIGAVLIGVILQASAVHLEFLRKVLLTTPLDFYEWALVALIVVWTLSGIELAKKAFLSRIHYR